MKKIYLLLLCCGLFPVFLAAAVPPDPPDASAWTVSKTENGSFTVTFRLPAGVYAYQESTFPETEPVLKPESVPAAVSRKDSVTGENVSVYAGPGSFQWRFSRPEKFPFRIRANWQACSNEGECYLPSAVQLAEYTAAADWQNNTPVRKNISGLTDDLPGTEETVPDLRLIPSYTILRSASGYMPPAEFAEFLQGKNDSGDLLSGGMLAMLLIVLTGGLLLNLTPCVLPLIPVNLAMIGATDASRSRGAKIFRGFVYGLGIAVAYGILGVIAVMTGATFGALANSWLFNGIVAVIFLLLSLAMFGVFQFDLSRYGGGIRMPESLRLGGVFFMGALSAVLAGACVAPVLAAVLLRAGALYAEGSSAGLLLPFLLGAGMALPWPFAAAGLSLFPPPGVWMIRVKQLLGLLILCLAVYYGYLGFTQFYYAQSAAPADKNGGTQQLAAALIRAQQENKLLLLDFGASWCKNCHAMEKNTFTAPAVRELQENIVVLRIAAENPEEPETAELLRLFGVVGLPHYALLAPEKDASLPDLPLEKSGN